MPLQNANRAAMRGITTGVCLAAAARRAYQPSGPPTLSRTEAPCGGRNAAARIISRTRDGPNFATTLGTVTPPSECPQTTIELSPAFSISVITDSTQSSMVTADRSPGLPRRPGRSTASTLSCGATTLISSTVRSQQSAAWAPPWTSTSAGNAMATHPRRAAPRSASNRGAQLVPVARRQPLPVRLADLGGFQEPAGASVRNHDVGIVGGEHDAVGTDDVEGPLQIALAENPSRRNEDVAAHVLRDRAGQVGDAGHPADAVEIEQHHFTPVPQNPSQAGKAVQYPAEDEAHQLQPCVVMPAQTMRGQCRVDSVAKPAVVGTAYGRVR